MIRKKQQKPFAKKKRHKATNRISHKIHIQKTKKKLKLVKQNKIKKRFLIPKLQSTVSITELQESLTKVQWT